MIDGSDSWLMPCSYNSNMDSCGSGCCCDSCYRTDGGGDCTALCDNCVSGDRRRLKLRQKDGNTSGKVDTSLSPMELLATEKTGRKLSGFCSTFCVVVFAVIVLSGFFNVSGRFECSPL